MQSRRNRTTSNQARAETFERSSLPAEGTEAYKELIQDIIAEFRANDGQVGGPLEGVPLLLTTTGARTGLPRTNPVAYMIDNGWLVFTAAKEGDATKHPDWFYNLRANPDVTVELGTEVFPARATIVEGAERQRLRPERGAPSPGVRGVFAEDAPRDPGDRARSRG